MARDVLILIYNNIFEIQLLAFHLLFPQNPCGIVDHVLEVYRQPLLQPLLIFVKALLTNEHEQLGALIGSPGLNTEKIFQCQPLCLEIPDEGANQLDQSGDVFVFLRAYDFVENLTRRPWTQLKAMLHKLLLQMLQEITPVIVIRISENQLCAMFPVQRYLILDFLFVPHQLFFGITAVPSVFRNAEMLDISHAPILFNGKIRRVKFVGTKDMIRVRLLIRIINPVHEQEIRNPHFLCRAQCLMGNADTPARPTVNDLLRIFLHIAFQGRKVGLGYIIEKSVKLISFVGSLKIASKEEDELVHQPRRVQYIALQILVHHMEHEASIHHRLPVRVLSPENGIARFMERRHRAVYPHGLVDLVTKLTHGLVGERDDQYLVRPHFLAFHKILHFCRHGRGLSGSSPGHDQSVVLIRKHHTPLFFVKPYARIHVLKNVVQIIPLFLQMFADKVFIMLLHGLRFARCQILIKSQKRPRFLHADFISLAVRFQHLRLLQNRKKGMDIRIHLRKTFIITASQEPVAIQNTLGALFKIPKPFLHGNLSRLRSCLSLMKNPV